MSADDSKEDTVLDVCEKAFCDEKERAKRLEEKAEKYLAAIGVITGLGLYSLTNLVFIGNLIKVISSWLAIAAFVSLGAALLFSIESRGIKDYVSYPRGKDLIDKLIAPGMNTSSAKMMVADMFLEAHNINAVINDQRANLLRWSEKLIVIGFVLGVGSYLVPKVF